MIVFQDTTLKLDFVSRNMPVACLHHNLVLYDGRFHKRGCDNDYDSIHLNITKAGSSFEDISTFF